MEIITRKYEAIDKFINATIIDHIIFKCHHLYVIKKFHENSDNLGYRKCIFYCFIKWTVFFTVLLDINDL